MLLSIVAVLIPLVLLVFYVVFPLTIWEFKKETARSIVPINLFFDFIIIAGGFVELSKIGLLGKDLATSVVYLLFIFPLLAFFGFFGPVEQWFRYGIIALTISLVFGNTASNFLYYGNFSHWQDTINLFWDSWNNLFIIIAIMWPGFRFGGLIRRIMTYKKMKVGRGDIK